MQEKSQTTSELGELVNPPVEDVTVTGSTASPLRIESPPVAPKLNRHQRRALEAIARKEARRIAKAAKRAKK